MAQALKPINGQVSSLPSDDTNTQITTPNDRVLAMITVVYLLVMLAVVGWLLFDTWIGTYAPSSWMGYDQTRLDTPAFRLVAYTVIGGALGALVNGIRSFLDHQHKFAGRYVWKYITAPWMGAALALFVYALIHSSTAVLSGSGGTTSGSTQALANFAAGVLAGYGAKDVFIWLDEKVQKLFEVEQETTDVEGQTEATAATTLHRNDLAVGNVSTVDKGPGVQPGTVVEQTPPPGTPIARGDEVSLAIQGKAQNGHDPKA